MILNFFSDCIPLDVGCKLYSDPEYTIPVPDSFYSDGTDCYTLVNGIITAKNPCVTTCDLVISNVTSTDPTTLGGTDGTITIVFTGSNGPFTYSIANAVLGSDPFIIGGAAVSPLTITGLSSNISYSVTIVDANNCTASATVTLGQSATLFDADWIQITYEFTAGRDLDTRTRIVSPNIGQDTQAEYLGYYCYSGFDTVSPPITSYDVGKYEDPNNYMILFGGDNRGLGFESVLINIKRFKQLIPGATEIVVDIRGFWHTTGEVSNVPVNAGITLWKDKTPKINTPLIDGCVDMEAEVGYQFPFCWTYADALYTKTIDSVPKEITLQHNGNGTSGQRIATLKYNLTTFVTVLNNADVTTPSV